MVTIYHNPRCRKSREALKALEGNGVPFQVVEYLKQPLSEEDLKGILLKLDIEPQALVRKNEAVWKENFKGKTLSDSAIIKAMAEHPKLIERPIVVRGAKAVVARPVERLSEIF